MGVFCDRLKFGSTATLDYSTSKNKGADIAKQIAACYLNPKSVLAILF